MIIVVRELEVDGITSEMTIAPEGRSITVQPMFDLKQDHYDGCAVCAYVDMVGCSWPDSYQWMPGTPILRFTSSGLEVSGEVSN